MQINRENKIHNFEKFLLIFTLFDILFAPYVYYIAITYSQLFIFIWFLLKDKRYFKRKEVRLYYSIFGFILLSVITSLLFIPKGETYYVIDNLKIGLNLALGVSYYFFFYYMFLYSKIRIEKWLIAYVLMVTLWGVLYFTNLGLFIDLKLMFNPRDSTVGFFLNGLTPLLRFNYIYTDSNNLGYALVGVVTFLIMNKRVTNIQLIVVVLCLLFNLFIIMSTGAIIATIISIPLAYLVRLKDSNSGKLANLTFIVLSIIFIMFIGQRLYTNYSEHEIIEYSINRQELKSETGDTRPIIWKKLIDSKKQTLIFYILTGEGSLIFVDGKPYKPHNGHLFLIFAYGFICYLFYMLLFFKKASKQRWVSYLYIFPFFLCFSVNIGIRELKFAAIMYMIIAASRILTNNKKNVENNILI